jgi:Tol biopolymer transport system component
LLLLSAFLWGCRGADAPTTIARYRDHPNSFEAGLVVGLTYDPEDLPLLWQAGGDLLVAHRERYTRGAILGGTCAGSGVYLVPTGGGAARVLTVGKPVCDAWSEYTGFAVDPAGAWVVYAVHARTRNTRLVRFLLGSGTVDSVPPGCRISLGHPAVSRDGRLLAAVGVCSDDQTDWAAFVFGVDGSAFHEVARMRTLVQATPAWSPDNGSLVLQRDGELVVIDLKTGKRRALAQGGAPSWSPDGAWIAFSATERDTVTLQMVHPDGTARREVFRSRATGTRRRGRSLHVEGAPQGPLVWSPDSKHLAFARRFGRGTSVWRVEIASGALRQVTAPDRP